MAQPTTDTDLFKPQERTYVKYINHLKAENNKLKNILREALLERTNNYITRITNRCKCTQFVRPPKPLASNTVRKPYKPNKRRKINKLHSHYKT